MRLMEALKSYVTENSITVIESTLNQLREQMDFDAAAMNQLQFSIYCFQVCFSILLHIRTLF